MRIVVLILPILIYFSCKSGNSQIFASYSISFERLKGADFIACTKNNNDIIDMDTIYLTSMLYPNFLKKEKIEKFWTCSIVDSIQKLDFTSSELKYFENTLNKIIKMNHCSPTIEDLNTIYKKTFFNSVSNQDPEWYSEIDSFYTFLNSNESYDICERIMYNSIRSTLEIKPNKGIYLTKKYSKSIISKQFVYIELENNEVRIMEVGPNIRNYNFE